LLGFPVRDLVRFSNFGIKRKLEKFIGVTAFVLSTIVAFSYRFPEIENEWFINNLFFLKKDMIIEKLHEQIQLLQSKNAELQSQKDIEIEVLREENKNLTEELKEKFLADSEDSRKGGYSHSRNCFQLSCIRKLEECEEKGYIGWKPCVESKIKTPKCIYFQKMHNDFVDYLKTEGKSKNTIASYRNVSCKFLIFVEKSEIADNNTFSKKLIIDFFIYWIDFKD
jgi:uncharacterized membrane protein YciS (DUF1049 family)